MMAKLNLAYAYSVAKLMQEKAKDAYQQLKEKIDLDENELEAWRLAAEKMYLPYDEARGIHPQDDSYLSKNFKNNIGFWLKPQLRSSLLTSDITRSEQ